MAQVPCWLVSCVPGPRWLLGLLVAGALPACAPRAVTWREVQPARALCYDRVPARADEVARRLEAAWRQAPETHFTAADLRRLRPAPDSLARADLALFKVQRHPYQNASTQWRVKTSNGQVLYSVTLQDSAQPGESALCADPLKWLTRPLPQAGLTAPEVALAREWMAQDLARLLPLLPPPTPSPDATVK